MEKGDIIEFGRYPQNNSDTKEPIKWLVLAVSGNEALIISQYGLDCKQLHSEYVNITWENCDLRKWLNNDFLKEAFTEDEIGMIKPIKLSELMNDDKDRVFCLSVEEAKAKEYFDDDKARQCQPTSLAKKHGVHAEDGYCGWLLRSQRCEPSVWGVYLDGKVDKWNSYPVNVNDGAVRRGTEIFSVN